MGSSKKHKKESKKHKRRSRSRSPHEKRRSRSYAEEHEFVVEEEEEQLVVEDNGHRREKDRYEGEEKVSRHKKHKKDRDRHHHSKKRRVREEDGEGLEVEVGGSSSRKKRHRSKEYVEVADDSSDSSDCVEVPVDEDIPAPPPPIMRRYPTPEPPPAFAGRRASPSPPPRVAAPSHRRRSPSPPRVAAPSSRKRTPSPPRVAPPSRRRSPSPPRVAPPSRRRSPSPQRSNRRRSPPPQPEQRKRSPSPIPENGAGDCLSVEETNKLRAKLGLKPLEVGPSDAAKESSSSSSSRKPDEDAPRNERTGASYEKIKDDWGEFYHKPATNLKEKTKEEKIREKLKERKEKRAVEEKLKRLQTLGEDEDMDDVKNWVSRSRDKDRLKKEADKRAKLLDQMDEEFGVGDLVDQEVRQTRKNAYKDRDLRGLRVEHDVEEFKEGRQVILTLKDADVLDEEAGDTLVNVNMMDDERYKKNVENRKQNPNHYGYNVYDEEVDEFGMVKERDILGKYNDELGERKKSSFTIGSNAEHEAAEKRRQLEIRAKLQNKKLDSLNTVPLALASEYFNETEIASFKKPKKKVRKIRQKLRADDLLASVPEAASGADLGSRSNRRAGEPPPTKSSGEVRKRRDILITDDTPTFDDDLSGVRVDEDDEDLQAVLSKARRLKQKEAIISKALPFDPDQIKHEIKPEADSEDESGTFDTRTRDGAMLLNATAEFCRTLGDIPTYGLAGNRDEDVNEMMDFEQEQEEREPDYQEPGGSSWNYVNTEREQEEQARSGQVPVEDVAILDEEPDVASSVAGALKLANSKGYLEKEESNRPSNARFAHLQAQNYSIEDKNYGDEDKYSRRDRFSGPISDFREKETFKPNVKLEYIDDSGHLLTPKEAFRYLSHKFHGKGPGKNKVEKRLKKSEQEGLMKKMSSTDTPLGTLNMLQAKQKETQSPFIVLSGKQNTSIVKHKR
ncbi:U4/U6.U5 tri-snRNP-associated protein 1 [Culex pipiens pallens]|uniref:U4/U6.U5 tri-snRNP-associated protein 1 n=1 Tax=Culex pipiens pallens TaxID=42434 RepID=UPI001953063E|nr:U4/U6.U5 tri-snRNP-associated protein 1 [Culex pipiens pallens]